jgi:hypothetical protein
MNLLARAHRPVKSKQSKYFAEMVGPRLPEYLEVGARLRLGKYTMNLHLENSFGGEEQTDIARPSIVTTSPAAQASSWTIVRGLITPYKGQNMPMEMATYWYGFGSQIEVGLH